MKRIKDAFAFARDHKVIDDTFLVADLERLHDLLTETSGALSYQLYGEIGARGECLLRLVVTGVLPLVCQRCLEAIQFELKVDNLLQLVPEGADLSQEELEDDTRDFLPLERELDVLELLEEEVLLALPIAPRHERCNLPEGSDGGARENPFAVLAQLKGKPN